MPSTLSNAREPRPDIADSLAEAIFSGAYASGDTIPREVDLCERFGVSRSTVRSALQKLVNAGLVVRISGQGTRVRELSAWHLLDPQVSAWMARYAQPNPMLTREVFAFRLAAEPFVAGLAAEAATAVDLMSIESAFDGMIATLESPDLVSQGMTHDDYDVAFHEAIFAASHNLIWAQISHVLKPAIAMLVTRSNRSAGVLNDSMARHRRMLEAIRLRQPEAAATAAVSVLERTAIDLGLQDLMQRQRTLAFIGDTSLSSPELGRDS
ncbi:FadR/GntR family transcriptional regulator [Salinicola aestuarinus]|uniref:FadR/GntR family transcriptional regulator n=1 Tax=Salinicola aestuarinus TaxID=1949082 RepID=UPI000DA253C9|nr:FCD domain-containing protein [Salinicola aestuarinus]